MIDNSIITQEKIEVYESEIFYYADEYISRVLQIQSSDKDYKKSINKSFLNMIFYIKDRIEKPSNDDIELLDAIFNIYTKLCIKYDRLPTLEVFSFLVGINRSTFTDWMNGEYRVNTAHSNTVKKWFELCKGFLVDDLHNSNLASVNKIFIAKAAYNMRETMPSQDNTTYLQEPRRTPEEIAARHAHALTQRPEKPEL